MKTFTLKITESYDLIATTLVLFSLYLMRYFDPLFDNYTYLSYHEEYQVVYTVWITTLCTFPCLVLYKLGYSIQLKLAALAIWITGLLGALAPYSIESENIFNVLHVALPNLSAFGLICLLKFYLGSDHMYTYMIGTLAILLVYTGYYTALVELVFIIINFWYLRKILKNNQII